jgi:hypothetical protein
MLSIQLVSGSGEIIKEASNEERVFLGYKGVLEAGVKVRIVNSNPGEYLWVKVNKCLDKSLVYFKSREMNYEYPFTEEAKVAYPIGAFEGDRHYFSVEKPTEEELKQYRNVALNLVDQKNAVDVYPHAGANVETRNESVFFASNAIDGICVTDGHGRWPYQSWGINKQKDAEITIHFGRKVLINKIGLFLRADYPHDSYWTSVKLTLSTGESLNLETTNSPDGQYFDISNHEVEWIKLSDLMKNQDESEFPALTQIEAYGYLNY